MTLITTPSQHADAAPAAPAPRPRSFGRAQLVRALPGALRKLNPATLVRNPVMLLVWVGAAFTTVLAVAEPFLGGPAASGGTPVPAPFTWGIAIWLWLTVLFANVAESVAEGRGKAQAASLRRTRTSTMARRVLRYDVSTDAAAERAETVDVSSAELQRDDIVIVTAGELIPGDGDIVAGIATVDESAITGESAPVIRESGGDRSAVTGGTRVLSDRIVVRITSKPGETFVDRMIALVEGASRQRTPNEIALNILLASLSIVFVVVVLALNPIAAYAASPVSIPVLIALLVCLIPTTIGALLSAIGIAGMDRLVQRNVLAMSGRAVEAAGDVTTLLLDKTGTITYGNRRAHEVLPLPGVEAHELLRTAALSSLADPTPEGASIVELAVAAGIRVAEPEGAVVVPFTAQTRMSGLDLADGAQVRKGAVTDGLAHLEQAVERSEAMKLIGAHALLLASLGEGYLRAGRLEDARRVAGAALALARGHRERGNEGWSLRLEAEIALASTPPDPGAAAERAQAALTLAEELGMRPLAEECRALLARGGRA